MKANRRALAILLFIGFAPAAGAQSVPPLVNYQGRLSNSDGSALATADYQLTFNIYDSATNSGTPVWGPQIFDSQTAQGHGPRIPVVQGYFNVMLGPVDTNGVSLANAFNATNRFVEITVSNHLPILPRQQILTAPFAFQAANSATLAGYDWSAILVSGNNPGQGQIAASKIQTGGITSSQIAPNTITAGQIANGSITAAQIAAGGIQGSNLANGTISSNQIAGGGITGTNLANGTITASQIANATITSAQLAGAIITSNQIVLGSISAANLAPGSVLTTNLADGSVTLPKLLARTAGTNAPAGGIAVSLPCPFQQNLNGGTFRDITNLVVTITTTGRPVMIFLAPAATNYVYTTGRDAGNSNSGLYFLPSDLAFFQLVRDNAQATVTMFGTGSGGAPAIGYPAIMGPLIDFPGPGQHNYKVQWALNSNSSGITYICGSVA